MFGFFLFAFVFAFLLTLIVIFSKMKVRGEIASKRIYLYSLLSFVLILFSWFISTSGSKIEDRMISSLILPSPFEVLGAFPKLHFDQGLIRSVLVSFQRVALGFSLGVIVSIPLGIFMASFPLISAIFKPISLVISYVPIVVFVPLTLTWWGADETQKIGFLFLACLIALLPIVIKSVEKVDTAYLEMAKTKGATQWQLIRHVLLPVAMADIWDGMRMVYGVGWTWIILAEIVNAQSGLGYLMFVSERRGHTNATFAIIIIIVTIAVLCDKVWAYFGSILFPYRRK